MEEESFKDVMGHAPVYSSGIPGVSVTNPAEFKEWHGRVRRAHEREVREHTLEYDIDGLSDRELAEHGLVRLPVDANGMLWTGDESEYIDTDNRRHRFNGIKFVNEGWYVCCGNDYHESLASGCRHVPDKPADPHAELADELDTFASMYVPDKDAVSMLKDIADRLRERRWRE